MARPRPGAARQPPCLYRAVEIGILGASTPGDPCGPVSFRSSTKRSGSYSHVFRRRGTYKILCTVHAPEMHMTITVR